MAEMAVEMLGSLESVSSLCDFSFMDEGEAEEALKKGEILGIMRIPEGMIRGIMDGTKPPRFTFFCRKTAWRPLCLRN